MTPGDEGLREEGAKALEALKEKTEDHSEEEMAAKAAATEEAKSPPETAEELAKALSKLTEQDVLRELGPKTNPEPEPTPEEAEGIREKKKARISQIMSGGILNERLQAIYDRSVPKGYRGKFVKDSDDYIIRYGNLGFLFQYSAGAAGLHETSDGRIRAGDLVLMTIPEEDYSILDEVRTEKVKQKLSAGRDEYHRQMQGSGQEDSITDESDTQISK